MKTLYYKTPMARKAAWDYCRRALAFMLCLVLLSGFAMRTAPRAKAVAGAVAGSAFSSPIAAVDMPGAATGLLSIIALGADMQTRFDDAIDNGILEKLEAAERRGIVWGDELWEFLKSSDTVDEECKVEWAELVEGIKSAGGIVAGSSFTLSAKLAETIRTWALTKFDFADGISSSSDYVIEMDNGKYFVLSDLDQEAFSALVASKKNGYIPVGRLGTMVQPVVGNAEIGNESIVYFSGDYGFRTLISSKEPTSLSPWWYASANLFFYGPGISYSSTQILDWFAHSPDKASEGGTLDDARAALVLKDKTSLPQAVLVYSSALDRLYALQYLPASNEFYCYYRRYLDKASEKISIGGIETTLTKTPALDKPVTEAKTVTIPADMPVTNIDDWSIPVIDNLTAEDLVGSGAGDNTGGETGDKDVSAIPWGELRDLLGGISDRVGAIPGSIADALPDALSQTMTDALAQSKAEAQAKAQEKAVEDALTAPDTLGGVFISKFPFCIPWDVVTAISLLAVPPVTPHWEIDFYEPLEGVGGFHAQGDTTVVIDFERFDFLAQVCRWVETCFFVYALAMGTKKLIWTA